MNEAVTKKGLAKTLFVVSKMVENKQRDIQLFT